MFDIEQFLKENNIQYYTSGKDVAKGNINIKCPFCGENDKAWHMGIKISKNWYGCWKDSSHRGTDICYLVAKLLNCSLKYAKNLVYANYQKTISNEIDLTSQIKQKLFKVCPNTVFRDTCLKESNTIEFDTFKTITVNSVYYRYLKGRGFDNVCMLVDKYNLKFAQSGKWKCRILFPVYINSELATWQGRDVTNRSKLKYLDESITVKECIYNYDNLQGDILYICEGVFDALKIDFYTPSYIASTCVFTKTVTSSQYKLFHKIIKKFKEIRILFDKNTIKDSNLLKNELSIFHKNIKVVMLPHGIKDAGDMTKQQIRRYLI